MQPHHLSGCSSLLLAMLVGVVVMLASISPALAVGVSGMGKIYQDTARTNQNPVPMPTTGSLTLYYTADNGDTGKLIVTPDVVQGYNGATVYLGNNGLMIHHNQQATQDRLTPDRFKYNVQVIPDNANSTPTVKIAQASYANDTTMPNNGAGGNSEIAHNTLSFTNRNTGSAATASYTNPSVAMKNTAMGDYFLGSIIEKTTSYGWIYYDYTTRDRNVTMPQLRVNSYGSTFSPSNPNQLFYVNYPELAQNTFYGQRYLALNDTATFTVPPNETSVSYAFFANTSHFGSMPADSGVAGRNNQPLNINKATSTNPNNQNSYAPLTSTLSSGSTYVTYGVANTDSTYVISVNNPDTVTLDYRGIMLGTSNSRNNNYGETFNEWISFGVSSTTSQDPAIPFTITKSDGVDSISSGTYADYVITVKNIGSTTLSGLRLTDAEQIELNKWDVFSCIGSVINNACNPNIPSTLPTKSQLEAGFTLPDLSAGQSYAIFVPSYVVPPSGSVTNTATVTLGTTTLTATDTNTIIPVNITPPEAGAACPSGDQMFFLTGEGIPTPDNAITVPITWDQQQNNTTAPTTISNDFSFNDGHNNTITMTIRIVTNDTTTTNTPRLNQSGIYTLYDDIPRGAILIQHGSQSQAPMYNNHNVSVKVNRPVSKIGFSGYDFDYSNSQSPFYIEQLDIPSNQNGIITPAKNSTNAYTLSNNNQTATATRACDVGSSCALFADWQNIPAGTFVTGIHSNLTTKVSASRNHWLGYGGFYFCLPPPKLTVNKHLTDTRALPDDQFTITVKDTTDPANITEVKSVTTAGTGSSINPDTASTGTLSLALGKTYNVTETAADTTTKLINYKTNYQCLNNYADSTSQLPASANSLSFNLANLTYSDNVTCTITNTPIRYTFSGIVFNDNGGETYTATAPTSSDNPNYFNGQFDEDEQGIHHNDLSVSLKANCDADAAIKTQSVTAAAPDTGKYSLFAVPSELTSSDTLPDSVCLVENEPGSWLYEVDTTPNQINVQLTTVTYNYPDNNFGEVTKNNAALVLEKRQYVHECDSSYLGKTDNDDPRAGFSTKPASNVAPGMCIAYKITAFNRGHVPLTNVVISDPLQTQEVGGATVTSTYVDNSDGGIGIDRIDTKTVNDTVNSPKQQIVISNAIATLPTGGSAVLYFDTQYGSSSATTQP